jgi:hypothetical protein
MFSSSVVAAVVAAPTTVAVAVAVLVELILELSILLQMQQLALVLVVRCSKTEHRVMSVSPSALVAVARE